MEQKTTKRNDYLIYKLFENLEPHAKVRFMRRYGLFQANFLNPELEITTKNIDRININDPVIKKMIINLEHFVKNHKRVIVINGECLHNRIVSTYNGLYDVVDSNDNNNLLVLTSVSSDKEEQLRQLKERKEQGFCEANLYAIDYELVRSVIPKLIEHYRKHTDHVPPNLTEGEWDLILRDITWLCNEYVDNFKNNDGSNEYLQRLQKAKEAFTTYFMELL